MRSVWKSVSKQEVGPSTSLSKKKKRNHPIASSRRRKAGWERKHALAVERLAGLVCDGAEEIKQTLRFLIAEKLKGRSRKVKLELPMKLSAFAALFGGEKAVTATPLQTQLLLFGNEILPTLTRCIGNEDPPWSERNEGGSHFLVATETDESNFSFRVVLHKKKLTSGASTYHLYFLKMVFRVIRED